jgi:hypothetical protein
MINQHAAIKLLKFVRHFLHVCTQEELYKQAAVKVVHHAKPLLTSSDDLLSNLSSFSLHYFYRM